MATPVPLYLYYVSRERAVEIVRSGNPEGWPKTKENKAKIEEMAKVLQSLTGVYSDCSWCARKEIYKHLKKWVEGNGLL